MKTIQFKDYTCIVQFGKYSNGRTAITLVDAADGIPVAKATINIPDAHLAEDEIIIKNYSENQGILRALVIGGIIEEVVIRHIRTGYETAQVCKLIQTEETP